MQVIVNEMSFVATPSCALYVNDMCQGIVLITHIIDYTHIYVCIYTQLLYSLIYHFNLFITVTWTKKKKIQNLHL